MMSDSNTAIKVLLASDQGQFDEWVRVWEATGTSDPFSHPAYVREFENSASEAACISWRNGDIILPLILRQLSAELWMPEASELVDAETPYGFGGPLAKPGIAEGDRAAFLHDLREWASSAHVVSLVGRLRVVDNEFEVPAQTIRQNIVRTTEMPLDELWYDYEHKVRKNVRRAEKHEVQILVDETGEYLDDFKAIYESTLDRRSAVDRYRFGNDFYNNLIAQLPGTLLFHARLDGKIVSSEIVLSSDRWAYSFLGGTLPDAFASRANDFLKHKIITWCHETGKQGFVLGGGYAPEDGIFNYKKSFAPTGLVPFQLWTENFNEKHYDSLLDERGKWERANASGWSPQAGYFPAYRAPSVVE